MGMSIPLLRVTSLRRCAQANTPAASLLPRDLDDDVRRTRRVHCARGAGGRACNAFVLIGVGLKWS